MTRVLVPWVRAALRAAIDAAPGDGTTEPVLVIPLAALGGTEADHDR